MTEHIYRVCKKRSVTLKMTWSTTLTVVEIPLADKDK